MATWDITSPAGATATICSRGGAIELWKPAGESESIIAHSQLPQLIGPCYGTPESRWGSVGDLEFEELVAGDALVLGARDGVLAYSATYSLETGASGEENVSLTFSVTNEGDTSQDVAIGWRVPVHFPDEKSVANMGLTVPARTRVMCYPSGQPLPGDDAFAGIKAPYVCEYIGQHEMRGGFTDLVPDVYGIVSSKLVDPRSSDSITLTQEPSEAPYVGVGTGEDLEEVRSAFHLGAFTHIANAANRADRRHGLVLEPGASRSLTATLTWHSHRKH